jgi:hypothetical protein
MTYIDNRWGGLLAYVQLTNILVSVSQITTIKICRNWGDINVST